jgi:DNA mismatch endonuclease (patch repair protein)
MPRDPAITSRMMARVKNANTKPEMVLRKHLHRMGVRYRLQAKDVFGKPDLAIAKYKLAVFVDGDLWHGNEHKLRGLASIEALFPTNTSFWAEKIRANMARDSLVNQRLTSEGWVVVRLWASEISRDPTGAAQMVLDRLRSLKTARLSPPPSDH